MKGYTVGLEDTGQHANALKLIIAFLQLTSRGDFRLEEATFDPGFAGRGKFTIHFRIDIKPRPRPKKARSKK